MAGDSKIRKNVRFFPPLKPMIGTALLALLVFKLNAIIERKDNRYFWTNLKHKKEGC
jgi:hypothetical protein